MNLIDVGEIIATRKLNICKEDEVVGVITINIGKPQLFPDSTDYFTPFQIKGIGSEKVLYAAGIDAVQSLQLAMRMIGAKLFSLRNSHLDSIFWEGDENGDLGFPLPDL